MGYPNFEVKAALQKYLLTIYTKLAPDETESISLRITSALNNKKIVTLIDLIKSLLVRVPYQLHGKDEKSYHAILQSIFMTCGIDTSAEVTLSHGRIDILLQMPEVIYVIE